MSADVIELVAPAEREWDSVGRLVLDGVADRLGLSVGDADDFKLALEWLHAEARPADGAVRWRFTLEPDCLVLEVGPLGECPAIEALRLPAPAASSGRLSLRRVLDSVVDSFRVEPGSGAGVLVRLEKRVRRS